MTFAIIASSLSLMTATLVAILGYAYILRIRSFDHFYARFAAAIIKLQADNTVPPSVYEPLLSIAPFAHQQVVAKLLVKRDLKASGSLSESEVNDMKSLSEHQAALFMQASLSLLMAISFRNVAHGRQFRERLYDRFGDKKAVIHQANVLSREVHNMSLCAA